MDIFYIVKLLQGMISIHAWVGNKLGHSKVVAKTYIQARLGIIPGSSRTVGNGFNL
jgi:hypothetical protein